MNEHTIRQSDVKMEEQANDYLESLELLDRQDFERLLAYLEEEGEATISSPIISECFTESENEYENDYQENYDGNDGYDN